MQKYACNNNINNKNNVSHNTVVVQLRDSHYAGKTTHDNNNIINDENIHRIFI